MLPIPADIFTEPDNVSPDGLANLGPLRHLAGVWQADKGVDVNPKAEGPERRIFREHIRMDPIDPQANGPQLFYGLRYHIHINTPEEDITFHDQVGYWLWEPATGLILQSVTIPRGQVLLAAGHAKPDQADLRHGEAWRYALRNCSTEFLDEAFRTESYRCDITFNDDGSWTYLLETEFLVKGRDLPFNHHDTNTLKLVGAAAPNPLAVILKDRAEKKQD